MYHPNIDQAVIIVGQIIGYTNESNKLIVSFSQRRDSAVKSFPRERIRILPPASTSDGQYLINSEWAQILNFAADSVTTNNNNTNINITPMDTELSETLLSAENGRCHILHSFSDDYDRSRWIHRWIDDVNLRDNLLDAHQDLLADHSTERILDIYTDGSMQLGHIENTISHYAADVSLLTMGAGVFVDRTDSQPITISSRLKDWPSSTCAELVAIFLALLITPMTTNINLYTDSQCALDAINNWKAQRTNLRLKQPNNLLLIKICMILNEKALNIHWHKVKGHTGIYGNDQADIAANIGLSSQNCFNNSIDFINHDLRFFPRFDSIPIENNLRKFITSLLFIYEASEWSLLSLQKDFCHNNSGSVDWKIIWIILAQFKGFRCLSTRINSLLCFCIKLFHQGLLVGTTLQQRNPDLYNDY
ncbi:hypothetical protein RclHR1_02960020 [Rhizophagus clarus]|uniref:RNase H type-1 domain-containing protein n=1 Tax=Rhizophagus clarus TaxID=94130 RepID=A0A2Z6R4N5_9GLOM|nr:hypothetical protein RclHR1_02960020 [Rhizophagus clarus]